MRDVAATLNGSAWITSGDGRVPNNRLLGLLLGDFLNELVTTLNPLIQRERYTDIVCIAAPFVVRDGELTTTPGFVMRTSRIDMILSGHVDLADERLNLSSRTEPRKGIGLSAGELINPFVRIGGTLESPRLSLDPTGTLVTGGATVATGGVWLLARGFLDSVFRKKDPCGDAMKEYHRHVGRG